LGFVAWLDVPLLQDRIARKLNGCKGVAIIISAMLVSVLFDYVKPVPFLLCGFFGFMLLQYMITDLDHSIIKNKTHRGNIFLKAAPSQKDDKNFEMV
jgi:hypothetical protein